MLAMSMHKDQDDNQIYVFWAIILDKIIVSDIVELRDLLSVS